MKCINVKHAQKTDLSLDLIFITESLYFFKATRSVIVDNKIEHTESEGFCSKEEINKSKEDCTLPLPDKSYIKKNEELLALTKKYGFVETLLEETSFNGYEPKLDMIQLIEDSQYSFNEISAMSETELSKSLMVCDYRKHLNIMVLTGEILNTAIVSDFLLLREEYYKDYKQMINEMIENKRINIEDQYNSSIFQKEIYSPLLFVLGRVNFTDSEFKTLVELMDNDFNAFNAFSFVKKIDLLGVNKYSID